MNNKDPIIQAEALRGVLDEIESIPGLDQNVNFFNVDTFLSWDFRLGCNLTVGYKNWIGDTYAIDALQYQRYLNNFSKVFDVPHGNELSIKAIYFLDYNQIRKKK